MAAANRPQKSGSVTTFGDGTDDIKFNCDAMGFYGTDPVARPAYTAATGTATRTTFATSTVTLAVLAEHVKALIDDLKANGILG